MKLLALLILAALVAAGCTVIEYRTTDGAYVRITKVGDTRIGRLEARGGPTTRSVIVENLDANQQTLGLLHKSLEKIP